MDLEMERVSRNLDRNTDQETEGAIRWYLMARGGEMTARVHPGMNLGVAPNGDLTFDADHAAIQLEPDATGIAVNLVTRDMELLVPGAGSLPSFHAGDHSHLELDLLGHLLTLVNDFAVVEPVERAIRITIKPVEEIRRGPRSAPAHTDGDGLLADRGETPTQNPIMVPEPVSRRPRQLPQRRRRWLSGPALSATLLVIGIVSVGVLLSLRPPTEPEIAAPAPALPEPFVENPQPVAVLPDTVAADVEPVAFVDPTTDMTEAAAADVSSVEEAEPAGDAAITSPETDVALGLAAPEVAASEVVTGDAPGDPEPSSADVGSSLADVDETPVVADEPLVDADDTPADAEEVVNAEEQVPAPQTVDPTILAQFEQLVEAEALPDAAALAFAVDTLLTLQAAYPDDPQVIAVIETLDERMLNGARDRLDQGALDEARELLDRSAATNLPSEERDVLTAFLAAAVEARDAAPSEPVASGSSSEAAETGAVAAATEAARSGATTPDDLSPSLQTSAEVGEVSGPTDDAIAGAVAPATELPPEFATEEPVIATPTPDGFDLAEVLPGVVENGVQEEPAEPPPPAEPVFRPLSDLKAIRQAPIAYPRRSLPGSGGTLVLEFVVSETGDVTDLTANGDVPDYFIRQAMETVRRWRFEPVVEQGRAVPVRTGLRITYEG